MIPLGLLHDAHYSQNVPKYLNVGSLGLTLAHEILHSLDQMGRGFDENGTRRVSFTIQTKEQNVTFCGQYTLIFLNNCWNIQFCFINTILLYQGNIIPIFMSVDTCLWPNVHSFCPPSILKKFYIQKYFGPPADLRHTLLSMYQKLLQNI